MSWLWIQKCTFLNLVFLIFQVEEIFANVKESLISFLNRSSELSSSSEDKQHHDPNQPVKLEAEAESIPITANDRANSSSSGGSGSRRPINVSTSDGTAAESNRKSGSGFGNGNGSNGHNSNNTKSNYKAGSSNNATSYSSHAATGGGNGSTNTGNTIKDEAIRKITTLKGNFLGPSFYLQEDFLDDAIKTVSDEKNLQKNGDVLHNFLHFKEQ